MSRRNIKPTTFHDDSRSSDAGSVVAAPTRAKPRAAKDPAKDLLALQHSRVDPQLNGNPPSNAKPPPLGPDGEIQVHPVCYLSGAVLICVKQVDFSALPLEALQKYKHFFKLNPSDPAPAKKTKPHQTNGKKRQHEDSEDELSNSEDDSPYRFDLGAWRPRINKPELAKLARSHFSSLPQARENDVIVQFLYAVKTQGTLFPLPC
jgi:hypothetical protein